MGAIFDMHPVERSAQQMHGGLNSPGMPDLYPSNGVQWVFLLVLQALFVAVVILLTLTTTPQGGWFSGLYVPDGVVLFNSAVMDAGKSGVDILTGYSSAQLLAFINRFFYSLHAEIFVFINSFILVLSYKNHSSGDWRWAPLFLLLIPYMALSALLPSKDVWVLFIWSLMTRHLARRDWAGVLLALLTSLLMVSVRDGFGFILIAVIVFKSVCERMKINSIGILGLWLMICAMLLDMLILVFGDAFLLVRSVAVAKAGLHSQEMFDFGSYSYFVRIFGNFTNLAFRPVLLATDGSLHVLSLLYWISGISLLASFAVFIRNLKSTDIHDRSLSLLALMIGLGVSVSPFVQPRYLLPLITLVPMIKSMSVGNFLSTWCRLAVVSLLFALLYNALGNYPPAPSPVEFIY